MCNKTGLLLCGLVLLVWIVYDIVSLSPQGGTSKNIQFVTFRDVSSLSDTEQAHLLGDLVENVKAPIAYRGINQLKEWKAFEMWNPLNFPLILRNNFTNVMENSSPLYYYYQMNVPMTKNMDHFKMDWKKPYNVLPTCSPNEFLLKSKRQYMYFSTPFKEYDESLNEYIQPNHLFKLGKDLQFNFWLSTQNVTSQCHFDSAPNFYLQIHGRKKFIFFSPADWSNIYIFPRLHPATRQSQVNFSKYYETTFLGLSSPDPTFPNFAKSQPLEITLSPGDFLYLPPFWFHHVIVLDDLSVSISLYHEGLKESLLKIYSKPFPLHDFRRADQEMVVYLYIEKLIKSLLVHQEPKTFILKIIEAKYSHLHLDPLLTNSAEAFGYKFHIVTYILRSLGLKSKTFCASSSTTNLLESPIIQEHYQNVERFFTNLDANLVELLLSDYIEELLSYLVGPDKILSYMEDCFNLSPLQILNTSPTTQYL